MKLIRLLFIGLGFLLVLLAVAVRLRYGGGDDFPMQRLAPPSMSMAQVETVADLPLPPGNLAVSRDGRLFFTLHPEARPQTKVAQLVGATAVPFPSRAWQSPETHAFGFQNVLSVRIDRQNRLWVLDNANHGLGQPRMLVFDIASGELLHKYDFDRSIAPRLSHLNDFQISADSRYAFIADASILGLTPALIIYDSQQRSARRLLEDDISVLPERYVPTVQGRRMQVFGLFAIRPGVDSIALSRDGQWLYFAAVTATRLYRAKVTDLLDASLAAEALAKRIEALPGKPETDGITTDNDGNVYLSDPGHSAIHRLSAAGKLETLLSDPSIRWPDGFSFGPDGWLYFSCSALHQVIGRSAGQIRDNAPYQIFRFKPGPTATPGH